MNTKDKYELTEVNIIIFLLTRFKSIVFLAIFIFIIIFGCFFFIKQHEPPEYSLNLYINSESETLTKIKEELSKISFFYNLFESYEFESFNSENQSNIRLERLDSKAFSLSTSTVFKSLSSEYFENISDYEKFEIITEEQFSFKFIKLIYSDFFMFSLHDLFTFKKNDSIKKVTPIFEVTINNMNNAIMNFYLKEWDFLITKVGNFINQVEVAGLDISIYKGLNFTALKSVFAEFKNSRQQLEEYPNDFFNYNLNRIDVSKTDIRLIGTIFISSILSLIFSLSIIVIIEFIKNTKTSLNEK